MQKRRLVAIVLLLTLVPLSGCVTERTTPGDRSNADPDRDESSLVAPSDDGSFHIEAAPSLRVGTTFLYEAEGPWAMLPGFHVVVAEASPDGYLMAGATREDLTHAILEGSPLFGHFSADWGKLNPGTGEVYHQNLEFPMHDGKEWSHGDWTYNAEEVDLQWTDGEGKGFRIDALRGKQQMTYEWSPDLGFFVSHRYEHTDRGLMWDFRLDAVLDSTSYTWFDYTAWGWTGTTTNATTVTVPKGTDTAFLEAYGAEGARMVATAPDGRVETFETTGRESALVRSLPAAPGEWSLGGLVPPDEQATLWLVTVAWEEGILDAA